MQRNSIHRWSTILVLMAFGICATGCKVTSKDVAWWQGTVKGPGKIVAVLLSPNYPIELRTESALALVEMERNDVDGLAELKTALTRLEEKDRKRIIDGMVPVLVSYLEGKGPEKEKEEGEKVSSLQIRAKDACYILVQQTDSKARDQLTKAVVDWYLVDFNDRNLAGNFSAEQVIRALGAPGAYMLVDALEATMVKETMVQIARIVSELGDAKTKSKAGKKLVEIEIHMESQEFLTWLENEIAKQIQIQDKKADPALVAQRAAAAAPLNRENFINLGALRAMKFLSKEKIVADRLVTIIGQKAKGDSDPARERRTYAMDALEGAVPPNSLKLMLSIALDSNESPEIRDMAFDHLSEIKNQKIIPSLWKLFKYSGDDQAQKLIRWRVGELILNVGGRQILSSFFENLPSGRNVSFEPEELSGYAKRMAQMKPTPTDELAKQLQSKQWWNRVLGLYYFEKQDVKKHRAKITALKADTDKLNGEGWANLKTVGDVAKQILGK